MFALDMFFNIVFKLAEVTAVYTLPALIEPLHLHQDLFGVQTLKGLPRRMIFVDMISQTFLIGADSITLGAAEPRTVDMLGANVFPDTAFVLGHVLAHGTLPILAVVHVNKLQQMVNV